ncbi:MAG: hypothetical protein AABW89_06050 [Nanoarchaeota archaeon]
MRLYGEGRRTAGIAQVALATVLSTIALVNLPQKRQDSEPALTEPVSIQPTYEEPKRDVVKSKKPSVRSVSGLLPVGIVYPTDIVPANMCSRYARLAAEDIFGIQYPRADAWDIRNDLRIEEISVKNKLDLERLENEGRLRPGMLVGFFNPNSKYNGQARDAGAGYTHVALYLGEDGDLIFADKFGKNTRQRITIDEILSNGNLEPREVLFNSN